MTNKEPIATKTILEVLSKSFDDKIEFIKLNKYLEILINDTNVWVRIAVAKYGKGYEWQRLTNDPNLHVAWAVVKQGYGDDKTRESIKKQVEEADIECNFTNQHRFIFSKF